MSKQLVLMRHSKSDWSVPGQRDFDRELNHRGHREAPLMGARLKIEKSFLPDKVVSSPATRAKLTTQYVCEQLSFADENILLEEDVYEASVRTLLRVINQMDASCNKLMVVGHNPGLSYFAEYLTKENVGDMPTSAILSISFDLDNWAAVSEGTGKIDWYIYPKDSE